MAKRYENWTIEQYRTELRKLGAYRPRDLHNKDSGFYEHLKRTSKLGDVFKGFMPPVSMRRPAGQYGHRDFANWTREMFDDELQRYGLDLSDISRLAKQDKSLHYYAKKKGWLKRDDLEGKV